MNGLKQVRAAVKREGEREMGKEVRKKKAKGTNERKEGIRMKQNVKGRRASQISNISTRTKNNFPRSL